MAAFDSEAATSIGSQNVSFVTDIFNTIAGGKMSLDADAGVVTYRQPDLTSYLTAVPSTINNNVDFTADAVNFRNLASEASTTTVAASTHFTIGAFKIQTKRTGNVQYSDILPVTTPGGIDELHCSNVKTSTIGGPSNGSVYVYGGFTGNCSCSSDDRLKSRTVPLASALPIVQQLNPVTYQKHPDLLVPEGVEDSDLSGVNHYLESGVVAQDIENIPELSHLVSSFTHPDLHVQLKSVSYDQLIPYLVKAVQELASRLAALETAQSS